MTRLLFLGCGPHGQDGLVSQQMQFVYLPGLSPRTDELRQTNHALTSFLVSSFIPALSTGDLS